MGHAAERAIERLAQVGIDPKVITTAAQRVADMKPESDVAVLMLQLPTAWGDTATDDVLVREANGNQVWAICRHGHVTTVMLRRDYQPSTPDAFGVDIVLRIKGAVIAVKP